MFQRIRIHPSQNRTDLRVGTPALRNKKASSKSRRCCADATPCLCFHTRGLLTPLNRGERCYRVLGTLPAVYMIRRFPLLDLLSRFPNLTKEFGWQEGGRFTIGEAPLCMSVEHSKVSSTSSVYETRTTRSLLRRRVEGSTHGRSCCATPSFSCRPHGRLGWPCGRQAEAALRLRLRAVRQPSVVCAHRAAPTRWLW